MVNEADPVLRDALGLPPRSPSPTANVAMMRTAGDDEDANWHSDFEPEDHRRPRVTEPSTPVQAGNEEVDFGVAQPPDDGLGFSPVREAARSRTGSVPPGFTSCNALTALNVADLKKERHRVRDKEKSLYAGLPRLEAPQRLVPRWTSSLLL